jgi:hypothetical protein
MVKLISDAKLVKLFPENTSGELTEISERITNLIQEYCNTTFEVLTYANEKQDSRDPLVLEHMPLVSVSSLVDNESTLVEGTDFYVYPDGLRISSPSGYNKAVTISYSAGFAAIPEGVKLVAEQLAEYWAFKESEGNLLFYKSQVFEEREYVTQADLNEQKILRGLRKYVQNTSSRLRRPGLRFGVI